MRLDHGRNARARYKAEGVRRAHIARRTETLVQPRVTEPRQTRGGQRERETPKKEARVDDCSNTGGGSSGAGTSGNVRDWLDAAACVKSDGQRQTRPRTHGANPRGKIRGARGVHIENARKLFGDAAAQSLTNAVWELVAP